MTGASCRPGGGDIRRWTLDNGLDVVFLPIPASPVTAVEVWYHAGSRDDPPGRRGLAHLLEHMMFLGTTNLGPDEHVRAVDRLGGQCNAFTEEDATSYTNVLPAPYADLALQLEAERMANLELVAERLEAERRIVKEEQLLQHNDPMQRAIEELRAAIFQDLPYAWSPAGTEQDLDRISIDDLQHHYRRHYRPDNATLVVVGNHNEAELRRSVQQHFGSLPPGRAAARQATWPQLRPAVPMRAEITPAESGCVVVGYQIPDVGHPDLVVLRLIDKILGGVASSRLFRTLVRQQRSARRAASVLWSLQRSGALLLVAAAALGRCGDVEQALLCEAARITTEPVPFNELDRAKHQLTAELIFEQQQVVALALRLGSSSVLRGEPCAWLADLDLVRGVTAEQVARVAATYLSEELSAVVVVPDLQQPPEGS